MQELPKADKLSAIHHYVPQSYLLRFSPNTKKSQIYTYEVDKKTYLTSISNIAGQRGFYNFIDTDGSKTSELEEAFALIDGAGINLIEALDKHSTGFVELPEKELADLYAYIAFLHTRNVNQKRQLANSFGETTLLQLQVHASAKEYFHKIAKEVLKDDYDYEKAENERNMLLEGKMEVKFDATEQYFMGRALDLSKTLYEVLWLHKKLVIVEKETAVKGRIITSDNPVTYYPPEGYPKGAPLGYLQAVFQVPVSPSRLLLLVNRNVTLKRFTLNERLVQWHNYYTFRDAERWVFSNSDDAQVAANFKKYNDKRPRLVMDTPFKRLDKNIG